MSDEHKALDTASIRAEANAATAGPWVAFNTDDSMHMNAFGVAVQGDEHRADDFAYEAGAGDAHGHVVAITLLQAPRFADHHSGKWEANAEFIANARTDVPALCDEVDRLRAELAALKTAAIGLPLATMPQLRAVVAALKGEPDPALVAARAELAAVKAERDALRKAGGA